MSEEPRSNRKRENETKVRLDGKASLANPAPTLNQMMPEISTADHSGKPYVHPSSIGGAQ